MDSFDSFIDLSQYEDVFQPLSASPITPAKSQVITRPVRAVPARIANFLSPSPPLMPSGPSHQYELFKQQTPFAPGAIATTLAVTQMPTGGFGPADFSLSNLDVDVFDFGDSPSLHADLDLDFDSLADPQCLFADADTINPSAIEDSSPSSIPSFPSSSAFLTTAGSVGRLWPGAHSQAALANAQIQTRAELQAQAQAQTDALALAQAQAQVQAQALAHARVQTQAHAKAQAEAHAHAHAQAHAQPNTQLQAQRQQQLMAQHQQRRTSNGMPSTLQDLAAPPLPSPSDLTPITISASAIGSSLASESKVTSESPQLDSATAQKISSLFSSIRSQSTPEINNLDDAHGTLSRMRKDDEDMDEDERLLVSEEGKKLSSKERRQLRNKVSARAFRSRRKEYITQLEAEIATKVTENGVLRSQNRALIEENKRLSDLSRLLLSSPSFSGFLEDLTANGSRPTQAAQQPTVKSEETQPEAPKDVNPYNATQQLDHLQMGVAMVPESNVDFSSLAYERDASNAFSYQPLVFALLATPDLVVDTDSYILSGKTGELCCDSFVDSETKTDIPVIDHLDAVTDQPHRLQNLDDSAAANFDSHDDDFESDPSFALYHSATSTPAADQLHANDDISAMIDWLSSVRPSKPLVTLQMAVRPSTEEAVASRVLMRLQRFNRRVDAIAERIDRLMAA